LVKEMARAGGLPAPYLAKIVQGLARRGIVETQRGIGGGVTLARAAASISLYDLCVALDDPAVQNRCMLGTAQCSDERACPAHQFWAKQRESAEAYLRLMTVADIAAFEARRRNNTGTATLTISGRAVGGGGAGGGGVGTPKSRNARSRRRGATDRGR
jgi:Rrf2 family protein